MDCEVGAKETEEKKASESERKREREREREREKGGRKTGYNFPTQQQQSAF